MRTKYELIDNLKYYHAKLNELGKISAAVRELGKVKDPYTSELLASAIESRLGSIGVDAMMIDKYIKEMEKLFIDEEDLHSVTPTDEEIENAREECGDD